MTPGPGPRTATAGAGTAGAGTAGAGTARETVNWAPAPGPVAAQASGRPHPCTSLRRPASARGLSGLRGLAGRNGSWLDRS
jgi:hypothetical protein